MYESQTFEVILERMLDRVPDTLDKREGSIIYNALAPAAWELSEIYIQLDVNNNLSFADTATDEFLTRIAAEQGINRRAATFARRRGYFYASGGVLMDVPIGSLYSYNNITYAATSRLSLGVFVLTAQTSGVVGNQDFGTLLPVDYVAGLVQAVLSDVITPGEDEEDNEQLRTRFFDAVNEQAFGGNVADYKEKVKSLDGVGGVKVYPAWQGGGTVKVSFSTSSNEPPTPELIDDIQTILDTVPNQGLGLGLAPIGHTVTVVGASLSTVNVSTVLSLAPDMAIEQVQDDVEAVVSSYLLSLRKTWESEAAIIVRVSQLESNILNVPGVIDITGTEINGVAANATLAPDALPVLGAVVLSE